MIRAIFNSILTCRYKLQLISLVLVALTLPFSLKLNNIAIGLLVLGWLLSGNYLFKLKKAFTNKLFLLFAGVYALQFVGLFYTSNMGEGVRLVETKAALAILPLILASSERLTQKHIYVIICAFIISCVLLTTYASFAIIKDFKAFDTAAGLTEFIDVAIDLHHAYSGMYLVFAVAASFYLAFAGNLKKPYRVLLVVTGLFLFAFLVIVAARTAVFTSFLLFFVFLVYSLLVGKRKKYLIAAAFASIALVVIVLSLPNTKAKIEEFKTLKGVHSPMTPRLIKWKCCFKVLKGQSAWGWGVGTGDVQNHLQMCYSEEKFWGDRYLLNAHNEFLEEMVRHGLPGVLLFVFSLFYPLWLSVKSDKKLYAIFLIVFIMSSLTESTLSRQKGVVFYALFNSLFAFSYLRGKLELTGQGEDEN